MALLTAGKIRGGHRSNECSGHAREGMACLGREVPVAYRTLLSAVGRVAWWRRRAPRWAVGGVGRGPGSFQGTAMGPRRPGQAPGPLTPDSSGRAVGCTVIPHPLRVFFTQVSNDNTVGRRGKR